MAWCCFSRRISKPCFKLTSIISTQNKWNNLEGTYYPSELNSGLTIMLELEALTYWNCNFLVHIVHQPFVTTASPPTGNSRDDFSSIIALLEALHCEDLQRVIALLFVIVNCTGVYLRNITSPSPGTARELERLLPHTIIPAIPPSMPVGGEAVFTNDWCISSKDSLRVFQLILILIACA